MMTKEELIYYYGYQEKCNKKEDYDFMEVDPFTGDHLCVFNSDDKIIVSVDATEGSKEWKSNFDFSPPTKGFHRSFYKTAAVLCERSRYTLGVKWNNIVIIGHSRGGGIAPILANLWKQEGYNVTKVITYAPPRCATLKGYRKLKNLGIETHMVKARRDIVDNVPPKVTPSSRWPFINIWKHYATHVYDLPGVDGFDHTRIREALEACENGH